MNPPARGVRASGSFSQLERPRWSEGGISPALVSIYDEEIAGQVCELPANFVWRGRSGTSLEHQYPAIELEDSLSESGRFGDRRFGLQGQRGALEQCRNPVFELIRPNEIGRTGHGQPAAEELGELGGEVESARRTRSAMIKDGKDGSASFPLAPRQQEGARHTHDR